MMSDDTGAGDGANETTGGEGSAPSAESSWKDSLPEDLKSDPTLLDIKDVAGLAKSYVHAQKLVGMDKDKLAAVPGEDSDEGTWNEFYSKIGRPTTKDEYSISFDPALEEKGVARSEELENWYKEQAHALGLTNKQASELYNKYMGFIADSYDTNNQHLEQLRDKVQADLKKEWGAAYDQRIQKAVAPLKHFADDEFVSWLDETGMGSHPSMIKFMYAIGEALGEDNLSDSSKSEVLMTPSEASAQISAKYADKEFMAAYTNKDHRSHKWAVEEMDKLYKYQYAK
jgi:hypothetical protein